MLPKQRWVASVLAAFVVPAFFAVAYIAIVVAQFGSSSGGFTSLPAVAMLFSNRWLLLAGWIHYLTFDLFVGSWEVRDARERGIPHLAVVPCLALTLMFGPAEQTQVILGSSHVTIGIIAGSLAIGLLFGAAAYGLMKLTVKLVPTTTALRLQPRPA